MTLLLTRSDVAALLPMARCIDALASGRGIDIELRSRGLSNALDHPR
jgi:hypothetical protein